MRLSIFLSAVFLFAVTQIAAAFTMEETFKKRIPADSIEEVTLFNTNGSIQISAWDKPEIEIIAYKKVSAGSKMSAQKYLEDLNVEITQTEVSLDIQTQFPRNERGGGFFSWLFGNVGKSASVRYEIHVPRKMDIEAHSTNGSINAQDCNGLIKLYTTNGKIEAQNIHGALRCKTTNGSINAEIKEMLPEEEIKLRTTNGSIRLYLPPDIDAALEAHTTNGRIRCELPLNDMYTKKKRRLEGRINNGGPLIYLKTTNGSIRILEN